MKKQVAFFGEIRYNNNGLGRVSPEKGQNAPQTTL